MVNTRNVLRRLVVRWWAYYHERLARQWLEDKYLGSSSWLAVEDAAVLEDCIRRVKVCTYWSWPRGSRIVYWQPVLRKWQDNLRDRVSV